MILQPTGAGRLAQDTARSLFQRIEWNTFVDVSLLVHRALQILLILLLALVAVRLLHFFTRRLERDIDEPDVMRKRLREQRLHTVASLLNYLGHFAIAVAAALMVLGVFINIGPLLAGVGVLGLAVSFGAQTLIKDLIAGLFMIVEGQCAVGDVVRVGDTAGMVERITLRTTVLRDLQGVVHVIPNGSIQVLSNLTKSWSKAVLDLGVAYKEEVDRVIRVIREEAGAMYTEPQWKPLILEEPQVLGVQDFGDSAVVIRLAFKTLPLKQWDVAREFRRRIKNRFDAEGIEIPFPHRTIYWGDSQMPVQPPAVEPGG